jgi:hypothetical protein
MSVCNPEQYSADRAELLSVIGEYLAHTPITCTQHRGVLCGQVEVATQGKGRPYMCHRVAPA